jgi:crotonobetainyl-CoA:carnitine CoA-transferase CaiB-like acyl-CoA transferase
MPGAFSGLRILDFTQGIAGPLASMLIGDFDAEVIKIEPPGGDWAKALPGYLCWNRNKQRLVLDVATYAGLATARGLLATADVAVFDAHPGELERLGLDATTLMVANPTLLHVSMPPNGTSGRWSQLPPSHDLLAAVSGMAHLQFSYADQPVHLNTPQLQYDHALVAAGAIGSALYERSMSGRGQAITVSGLHGVSGAASGGAVSAAGMLRMGGGHPRGGSPSYRLYHCGDGQWLFLGTLFQAFFLKALEAMDLLELIAAPGIDGEFTNLLRPPGNQITIPRLDARFAEKPRDEWLSILKANGVPCGPVSSREEWFHGPTVAANGMRVELQHPELGTVELPGVPAKLSATPGSVRHLAQTVKADALPSHQPTVTPRDDVPAAKGGPLAGIRVLDLGAVIAGTYAGTILANFGADVIKVEPPEGDPFRPYGLGFAAYNRGKRGVCLDLKDPAGRDAFLELARTADAVIDNYRLGVRERLRIDYATLRAINPRIVSCSVTAYGTTGPLSSDPGFDPLVQAQSGMMAAQGGDGEPVFYQIPVNDVASAMMAAFGVIAALYAREQTGEGQEVLTSLTNQSIICQSGELTSYAGRPANAVGGRDCIGIGALQRFYKCEDGWVAVACSEPEHFHRFCLGLGHNEWAGRFIAEKAMLETRDGPLAVLIEAALATMPRDEVVDRLLTAGVPAAPVTRIDETFGDPWLAANRFFEQYEHPQFGTITGVRGFADYDRTTGGFVRQAPLLGEHSREVLRDIGIEASRIEKLIAEGVVKVP